MATAKQDMNWQTIDDATLSLIPAWSPYQELLAETAKARVAFETACKAMINEAGAMPEGKTAIFSYRFGKPGIAFIEDKGGKASAGKFSFTPKPAIRGKRR